MRDRRSQGKLFEMIHLKHIEIFLAFDLYWRRCFRLGITLAIAAAYEK
jgi:hypothetical protein